MGHPWVSSCRLVDRAIPRGCRVPKAPLRSFLPALGDSRRTFRLQKVVAFPQQTIFGVVAAVEQYAEFLPWCVASRVHRRIEIDGSGGLLETEITVGFELVKSSFRSKVMLQPFQRIHAVSESNQFIDDLKFAWDFTPIGDRACRLDLELGENEQRQLS